VKVLVTFAVEAEFAPWRKLRDLRRTQIDALDIYQAQIGRASVDFIVTGMGPANARRACEIAMTQPHTICIASGFAGALKPIHKPGTILVARSVQQLGKPETIECSRRLAVSGFMDHAVYVNMFLSTDQVVSNPEAKRQLSPFADAVDMESFTVLSVARENNLPAVAIRVISDSFEQDLPVEIETTVDDKGQVRIAGVLKHIARHPLQLPALIRLGRQSRTAAEALASFLEAYIKLLSMKTHGWPPAELREVAAR
jgi:nucleoside phosphorylase